MADRAADAADADLAVDEFELRRGIPNADFRVRDRAAAACWVELVGGRETLLGAGFECESALRLELG